MIYKSFSRESFCGSYITLFAIWFICFFMLLTANLKSTWALRCTRAGFYKAPGPELTQSPWCPPFLPQPQPFQLKADFSHSKVELPDFATALTFWTQLLCTPPAFIARYQRVPWLSHGENTFVSQISTCSTKPASTFVHSSHINDRSVSMKPGGLCHSHVTHEGITLSLWLFFFFFFTGRFLSLCSRLVFYLFCDV